MQDNYGVENISHLETREAMRSRIEMYLGSNTTDGIYQAFKEIINNSTDEAIAGYGDKIFIRVNEESNSVEIRDLGRGVPFGIVNGKNILVAIYTEAHTGGKFDKGAYKNSSGLNGIGGTAVCMSSKMFKVTSIRNNIFAEACFEEGNLISYKEDKCEVDTPDGTLVAFAPDKEVFKNMEEGFSFDKICAEVKNIAYLNKGIHFIVEKYQGESVEYYSNEGIADFIKEKSKKPLMKKPIICSASDGTDELEIAFMWTGGASSSYVFVNGLYVPEGGSPITGAKTALTNSMKKLSGKDFDSELIRKGLVYAINCKVTNPSFANQTKTKINNPNLRTLASQAFKNGIEEFSHSQDFKTIVDMLTKIQRAEKAADKAREAILNQNKSVEKESKKKAVMGSKLKDCRIHDEKSILYIAEGDSALGAFTASRDSTYVAAMPIRGKIINALKNPLEKVLENEEVQDVAKACGCGILDKVKVNNLRYGKIAFAADADPDGFAIVCLLLVLFYVLMPELIKEGKIYWAQFPSYEITINNKLILAYNDKELASILAKYPNAKYDKNKGLGEMDAQAFAEAAYGENARLIQFTMDDIESAAYTLELLLGKRNEERSDYIFSNVDFKAVEGE